MFSKTKAWSVSGFIAVIILSIGLYVIIGRSKSKPTQVPEQVEKPQIVEEIKSSDIGLEIAPRGDNQAVNITIVKLSGISSIEYEVDYLAQGNIPRGVIGTISIKPEDTLIKREILLGTCSANVCKYDKGVKEVKLIFKINYSDGRTGTLQEKVAL